MSSKAAGLNTSRGKSTRNTCVYANSMLTMYPMAKQRPTTIAKPVSSKSTVATKKSTSRLADRTSPSFSIGQRVTISTLSVNGVVRFIGETKFKPGLWVGIQVDIEGTGKNDGSVQGERYFSCPSQSGLFSLADKVTPLRDPLAERSKFVVPKPSLTTTHPIPSHQSKRSVTCTQQLPVLNSTPSTRTNAFIRTHKTSIARSSNRNKSEVAGQTKDLHSSPASVQPKPSRTTTTVTTTTRKSMVQKRTEPAPENRSLHRSKSMTTRKFVSESELQRMHELLEQTRQEKQKLNDEMNGKEAAWERLVSTKESYALRIQEKDDKMAHLTKELTRVQRTCADLEQQLSERDATVARQTMTDVKEQKYIRRIEFLEECINNLKKQLGDHHEQHELKMSDKNAQAERLNRVLAEHEATTEALEQECLELRTAHLQAAEAHQREMMQMQSEYHARLARKDDDLARLARTVEELEALHAIRPSSPEDTSPRKRLEEQLKLTADKLDEERTAKKAMAQEMDQLRQEMKRLLSTVVHASARHDSIQDELEREVADKRRIMEEADAVYKAHAKAEDELHYLRRVVKTSSQHTMAHDIEQQLESERQRIKQLEHDQKHCRCTRRVSSPISPMSPVSLSRQSLGTEHEMYCELCESYGHDVIGCTTFGTLDTLEVLHKKSLELLQQSTTQESFCLNCDIFGSHATSECPNQNETF